jgi:hypothetical protein
MLGQGNSQNEGREGRSLVDEVFVFSLFSQRGILKNSVKVALHPAADRVIELAVIQLQCQAGSHSQAKLEVNA